MGQVLSVNSWIGHAHDLLDVVLDQQEMRRPWEAAWKSFQEFVDGEMEPLWRESFKRTEPVPGVAFRRKEHGPWDRYEQLPLGPWSEDQDGNRSFLHRTLDNMISGDLQDFVASYMRGDRLSWIKGMRQGASGEWLHRAIDKMNESLVRESGRENSTAMAVLPAEPPGKNVCAWLRGLVGDRSKLIVVAQPGRLHPGNLERLLRASMPDVEKKLRVMDAGESLADAVNSAERNHHYRPGQALEVYCDTQLGRNFAQEIRDGHLGFDPTVVLVHPGTVPRDDPDGILKAVHDDDPAAMHRVLDPHVFSSPDSLASYKSAVFGESVIREFLTDLAPNREVGIMMLHDLVRAELGDEYADGLVYLGTGRNGSAYRTPDGLILKVTTDPAEVASATKLLGVECEHIHEVYAVERLGGPGLVYALLQEGGLEPLPPAYAEELDIAVEALDAMGAGHYLRTGDMPSVLKVMGFCEDREMAVMVAETLDRFDVAGMAAEVLRLGLSCDLHSGNVMLREGRPVLIDLGTPGEDPNMPAEDISSASGDGHQVGENVGMNAAPSAGPSFGMRSNTSSAFSNGRMVLQKPKNFVPDDENASERDQALDQDIVGGGLDWGFGRRVRGSV